jgi:hypothetical protein
MSRARDRLPFAPPPPSREHKRLIENEDTLMYAIICVVVAIGVILSMLFWAF